jgi:hypothetical protein
MRLIRVLRFLLVGLSFAAFACAATAVPTSDRSRLIVLADMGNEPDEEQQMIHLLMCHNEFDLEGLIAVTGIHLQPANRDPYRRVVHPELFHRLIDGYDRIYPNLHRHARGWLSPFNLRVKVVSGQPDYGMDGVGPGKTTTGSELIIRQVTADDPRPVHLVANAGSNTLAQALVDYRATHTPAEVDAFVAKLRVFENGAQDDAGAWITHTFPNIHWIRGKSQSKCYGGPVKKATGPHTWKPYPYSSKGQDDWAQEHIRTGHGALGELYPMRLFSTTPSTTRSSSRAVAPFPGWRSSRAASPIPPNKLGAAGVGATPPNASPTSPPMPRASANQKSATNPGPPTPMPLTAGSTPSPVRRTTTPTPPSGHGVRPCGTIFRRAWTGA